MPHSEFTVTVGELIESNLKNPVSKFTYINANRESGDDHHPRPVNQKRTSRQSAQAPKRPSQLHGL
jgi:hypothetical protein